ncbi:MAG: arylsulfotransferase family protein [Gemmatimonadales bacterium]
MLSATITASVRDADSVAASIHAPVSGVANVLTPIVRVSGGGATIPLLGLLPGTAYTLRVVAYGPGGTELGPALPFTTGMLPADLPAYVATGPEPSPGFVAFAAGKYALVIDNTGRVVWYRHFPNGAGLNFMAQPTGRYVLRPQTPETGDLEPWVEIDPVGEIVRTLSCASGLQPRLHDLLLEPDGAFWILCDETRVMDLSAEGGVSAARVTGTVVQHVGAGGELLFQWNPFDHFDITDLDLADRIGPTVNWTHGNAFDFDADGNLLVSFRSLAEITKIDVRTGAVVWRMGGLRNEFSFVNAPVPAFARQHSARVPRGGELVLLDNLGDPAESRAERYLIDEATRTVQLAQSYGAVPAVVTEIGGSVQPIGGGRTLVSFGTAGRVEEYDAAGRLVWRIEGNPGYVFRAQRIRSLYQPGVGDPR